MVRRQLVDYARETHQISVRRACRVIGISTSVYRYRPDHSRDDGVIKALQEAIERYPAYGFGKIFKILRRWGHAFNHKRVHQVYCLLNLNKRRRGKRRLPSRSPVKFEVPSTVNQCWSIDFMSDSLFCGRPFRTFNVVDDFNREALAIEVDLNLPAPRIIRVLERICAWRGYPSKIRADNGPELVSIAMATWAEEHDIELEFIQPGKPTQNSYVERFNRTYRDEILNMYVFKTLTEVQQITEGWLTEYNEERPHDSLQDLTPSEFLIQHQTAGNSSYA